MNPSTYICESSKYLKSAADTSVTKCHEIVIVMNNLATRKTNTITKNVTSTASISCHSKKVRDCYILHTILLVIKLLLIIIIICYITQNKKIQYKMENKEFKKVRIKNHTCYYFDDIIKLEYFDIDNILIDEKSHKNILIYDISYKTLIDSKLSLIRFDKIDGFIRIYDVTRYLALFGSEKYEAIYNRFTYIFFTNLQKSKFIFMILYLQKKN